jgi:hypothetical protein
MLQHGQFTFSPSSDDYADRDVLPLQAPHSLATTLQASDAVAP